MTFGAIVLVRAALAFGVVGVLVIAVLVATTRWQLPEVHESLMNSLREARDRRRILTSFRRCQIIGRYGYTPRIAKTASSPIGRRYLLALPTGLHLAELETRGGELAAELRAREVRFVALPQSAGYVELVVIRRESFSREPMASPLCHGWRYSLWDHIPLGVLEDGQILSMQLAEHNLLIGGEPGSGKSVVLSSVVAAAALDPSTTLTLFDGKQVELSIWKDVADEFVGADLEHAAVVLERIQQTMDFRYQVLLALGKRKFEPDDPEGLHFVVVDELAFYLRGGKKDTRDRFAESLRDLVSRGRAAGIIVVAATQKPSHDIVPTWIRDLFSYRIAMRCTSSDSSDTILGQGWASRGSSAASINPSMRGVGYVLAEGGVPMLFKANYLSDLDLAALAGEAMSIRGAI
jgi:S-DNA-T family DNA segregation ATPase FtsK/SpoIIIE